MSINKYFGGGEITSKNNYLEAKFIRSGVIKDEEETYSISDENIINIANKFIGCPITTEHVQITNDNKEQLIKDGIIVGMIRAVRPADNGWYELSAIIDNVNSFEEAFQTKKEVSTGYQAVYSPNPTSTFNDVEINNEVSDVVPNHVALVVKGRYSGSKITKINNSILTTTMSNQNEGEKVSLNVIEKIVSMFKANMSTPALSEEDAKKFVKDHDIKKEKEEEKEEDKKKENKKYNGDDEIELEDGELVKMNELVDAYKKNKANKKKNEEKEEEEKKKDKENSFKSNSSNVVDDIAFKSNSSRPQNYMMSKNHSHQEIQNMITTLK